MRLGISPSIVISGIHTRGFYLTGKVDEKAEGSTWQLGQTKNSKAKSHNLSYLLVILMLSKTIDLNGIEYTHNCESLP